MFFFFSSRRRHTRCLSDWSSDVCSSDLDPNEWGPLKGQLPPAPARPARAAAGRAAAAGTAGEIGRASCRERVESSVVAAAVKKQTDEKDMGLAWRATS